MRIGIVSPYSLDVPGGVQLHVLDLARHLISLGHHVSVLAPADEDTPLPDFAVSAGRAVPVRFNGSVARLAFGPVAASRVSRWGERGRFDVVHIHEPISPSVSLLALWAVEGPVVATFHTSMVRSRAMQAAHPILRSSTEKITARIAVSEDARHTVTTHLGGDAVVIPNGVFVDRFAGARTRPDWQGTPERPTVAFLGRMGESRKGMPVLVEALPRILREVPGTRLLVAGPGDPDDVRAQLTPDVADAAEFLGMVSDEDKAALLASADVYVAPNTGGESFGIILIEAMSAGAAVLASDLPAFSRVLDAGRAGVMFRNRDAEDLAAKAIGLLRDPQHRLEVARAGQRRARVFDWSVVAEDVLAVYEMVVSSASSQALAGPEQVSWWSRLVTGRGGR